MLFGLIMRIVVNKSGGVREQSNGHFLARDGPRMRE